MSMATLKFFRLLVPGILIAIIFLLAIQDNFYELIEFGKTFSNLQLEGTIFMVVFVVVGAVYYIFNIRNLLWNPYHKRVQDNIKNALIAPFDQEVNAQQKDYLKDGRKLEV